MPLAADICLPVAPESVSAARLVLERSLQARHVDPDTVADVVLATVEACTNVVRHSGDCSAYRLRVIVEEDRCEVEVVDRGVGFRPGPVALPPVTAERGRGMAIMQALVDRAEIRSEPHHGTTVRLSKRFRSEPGSEQRATEGRKPSG